MSIAKSQLHRGDRMRKRNCHTWKNPTAFLSVYVEGGGETFTGPITTKWDSEFLWGFQTRQYIRWAPSEICTFSFHACMGTIYEGDGSLGWKRWFRRSSWNNQTTTQQYQKNKRATQKLKARLGALDGTLGGPSYQDHKLTGLLPVGPFKRCPAGSTSGCF